MDEALIKSLKFKKFKSKKVREKLLGWVEAPCQIKPGDVLEMMDGKYILVGDINKNFGFCDDCTNYGIQDIHRIATLPGF